MSQLDECNNNVLWKMELSNMPAYIEFKCSVMRYSRKVKGDVACVPVIPTEGGSVQFYSERC